MRDPMDGYDDWLAAQVDEYMKTDDDIEYDDDYQEYEYSEYDQAYDSEVAGNMYEQNLFKDWM